MIITDNNYHNTVMWFLIYFRLKLTEIPPRVALNFKVIEILETLFMKKFIFKKFLF